MEQSQSKISSVEEQTEEESGRQVSPIPFPSYCLADSVAVAKAIHEKGGGYATREQLAAFLEYKSVKNGAYLARIGAAKMFGLLIEEDKKLKLSPLAQQILMPESEDHSRTGLVDAFFAVPLFKAVYEEYKSQVLPEGLGLKNALRLKFKVVPGRIDVAYRVLYDSADAAGFFATKGSRTQLIYPVLRALTKPHDHLDNNKEQDDERGSGGGGPTNPVVKSRDDLQNEYIGTLIEALREKGKSGQPMDQDLMERIERLLEMKAT